MSFAGREPIRTDTLGRILPICSLGRPAVGAVKDFVNANTVVALHIAAESGAPMEPVERIEVRSGGGIVGDRYERSRHRHVTVQSLTQLGEAAEVLGTPIAPGTTRRNITLASGIIPLTPGDRFSIGAVELEVVRQAAPCAVLETSVGAGARAALRRRAGAVCRALTGGTIHLGETATLP